MPRTQLPPSRLAALAAVIVLVLACGGIVAASGLVSTPDAGAQSTRTTTTVAPTTTTRAPRTTTTTTAPPTTTTTTTFVEPAPAPAPPPVDEYAAEPHIVLGSIEIPKLGLSVPLNQGISLVSIDRGPSHWPGTAFPGQPGNVVVAGHRVTKTRPFRHIDKLVPGDEVIFTVMGDRWVYKVTHHEIVTPDGMHIVDQTPTPTATLFACHPPGSAKYRYVVKLALA